MQLENERERKDWVTNALPSTVRQVYNNLNPGVVTDLSGYAAVLVSMRESICVAYVLCNLFLN